MTKIEVIRSLGVLGILAGGGRLVVSYVPELQNDTVREALYLLIDLGLLFGLTGFFLAVATAVGRLGFLGYLVGASGIALISGPDGMFMGRDIYQAGSLVIGAGLVLLSVSLFLKGVQVLPGVFWVLAVISGLIGPYLDYGTAAEMLTGTFFGLGFLVAGLVAVTQR